MTQNELLLYRKSLQPSDIPFRAFSSPGWRVPALSVVPQMKQAWRWRVGVPVGAGGRGGLGEGFAFSHDLQQHPQPNGPDESK